MLKAATEYYRDEQVTLLLGDTLEQLGALPDSFVDCCITSPPYYGLRDYGNAGQYGLEDSPAAYVEIMRAVFAEVRRVLAVDGTCWINLGDSYAGSRSGPPGKTSALLSHRSARTAHAQAVAGKSAPVPHKNLLGMPWRVAFALQDDGWILRNAIVWHKPNGMPEAAQDRLTNKHELLFLLVKSPRYWFDLDAVRIDPIHRKGFTWEERKARGATGHHGLAGAAQAEPHAGILPNLNGANPGDVWTINTRPNRQAHFATFPIDLPIRCIKAGCKPGGSVLDPFSGSGTTGEAARMLGRRYVGIDLNPAYHDLAAKRFAQGVLSFEEGS